MRDLAGQTSRPMRWTGLGAATGFGAVCSLLSLAVPLYLLQIFDRVLTGQSIPTLVALSIATGGALVLVGILDAARAGIFTRLGARLDRQLYRAAASADLARASARRPGGTESTADLATVRSFLMSPAIGAIFDAPLTPVYVAVVYIIHPVLGTVTLVGGLVILSLAIFTEVATRRLFVEGSNKGRQHAQAMQVRLAAAESVRAMAMAAGLYRKAIAESAAALQPMLTAQDRLSVLIAIAKVCRVSLQVVLLGIGAYLVIGEHITAGMMIAASIVATRGLAPIDSSISTWRSFVLARAAWRRLRQGIAAHPERPGAGLELPRPRGNLTVRNLTYVPAPGHKRVIHGLSFELTPGEALAVIGPTAAGKSTLLRLLAGTLKPTSGEARLDGADIYSWADGGLGAYLGYLPQDDQILPGTVAENIARFSEFLPHEVIAAAEAVGVHKAILALAEGYDTEIGPRSVALSGGQRQRIGLARAVFRDPAVLILDEPESGLDGAGDEDLIRLLRAAKVRGATIVLATHRPTLVRLADKVLALRDGQPERFGAREDAIQPATRLEAVTPRVVPPRAPG